MKLLLPLVLDQAKEGRDSYVLYAKQVEILFKKAIFAFWGLMSPQDINFWPWVSTMDWNIFWGSILIVMNLCFHEIKYSYGLYIIKPSRQKKFHISQWFASVFLL